MEKKQGKVYTQEFREMALERMKVSRNISALAKELGIPRRRLYGWRVAQQPNLKPPTQNWTPPDPEKLTLLEQLKHARQLLGQKTEEVDFLKGALQRIEARRQRSGNTGGTASTSKSSK